MNELKGYDNWKLSHAEETECILQPCIVCSADAETPSAWLCFDCDMDFKAYDQMQVYGNQHGNSGVTGYFVDDSQNHLYVEFNDKVIYRYDQSQIGNQLYQNMIKTCRRRQWFITSDFQNATEISS